MHRTLVASCSTFAAWDTVSRFKTSRVWVMARELAVSSFWLMVSRLSSRVISPDRGLSSGRPMKELAREILKSG